MAANEKSQQKCWLCISVPARGCGQPLEDEVNGRYGLELHPLHDLYA
ncbi:hypothetical protein SG34_005670 [Thalassomonas viridans]|uniref:Uncharacterized protein n=1 Tax=Thalassomonas viridans TaxID=137584 RepID=A0AAE9Z5G6_9GAMM|nr:hypothetical protein [Thalassomonas viridans]WDE06409.1 hypothetical protein SG34_005670 [Thalassomonas viridans]